MKQAYLLLYVCICLNSKVGPLSGNGQLIEREVITAENAGYPSTTERIPATHIHHGKENT